MNKDIRRLVKSLEEVISQFKYVTHVDMEEDITVVKARKLIKELRGKDELTAKPSPCIN
jgi:hypothetical protein